MKKIAIVFVLTFYCAAAFSQTLFTYGNSATTKEEFLRAYNKNKPSTTDKDKAIKEYLDLYTNFKLKVKAAQELRLDTIAQIRYDVQNFRDQVIDNYLNDEKGMQLLMDEAVNRLSKDVLVAYFAVLVPQDAKPTDTLKAFNAAIELYNALKNGNNVYNDVTTAVSAKTYPAKFSDVGFITAFSVPYEYENIIYNTKIGTVSAPYRNSKGWNIFKVIEERAAVGKWKAAQLLFAYPPNADYNAKLAVKQKADSVYSLLNNGLSFANAAKTYSDDRNTNLSGGELQEFGTGKYNTVFSNNVFALKNDNDISKPFETAYGYHIVKRLGHTPIPTDKTDASYLFDVKQKITQDARINNEKEKFAKSIAVKTGYKKVAAIKNEILFASADSVMKNPTIDNSSKLPISKKVIASFKDGSQIKGDDWLKFVKDYKSNSEIQNIQNEVLLNKFSEKLVIEYYKKHLEEYNNDFKYQMQEFKEGNMLFEIMERNVWSKAGADSMGLKKYYDANKQLYKWAASADVLVFNCVNEKAAANALAEIKAGGNWAAVSEKSNNQVQADSGRYELLQLPGYTSTNVVSVGTFSTITKNNDNTAAFVKYLKLYGSNTQRNFAEARGLVINDYQNILEQQWVADLKKKFPVKVNEVVLKEMLK